MAEPQTVSSLSQIRLQEKDTQAVCLTSSAGTLELSLALLQLLLSQRRMGGVIVCIDRPYSYYASLLSDNRIETSALFYLDATGSGSPSGNVAYAEDVANLTALSIELYKLVERAKTDFPQKKFFVLFDSLPSLELYSERAALGRFLHSGNLRFRRYGVSQFYVIDPKDPLATVVREFCDMIVMIPEKTVKWPGFALAKALGWESGGAVV